MTIPTRASEMPELAHIDSLAVLRTLGGISPDAADMLNYMVARYPAPVWGRSFAGILDDLYDAGHLYTPPDAIVRVFKIDANETKKAVRPEAARILIRALEKSAADTPRARLAKRLQALAPTTSTI